ncbi:lysR family regulatory protein [Teratosphaeria nubilosa]|uniref:LysR family regulatory protein n=1 Tax=Teratosphaeria nubilosa TaxID=161662 RepID=A0A6G1LET9_9PEZI|nr:lysR family regulatory protein [Teratosphaeria nubilosa]
MGLFTSPPPRQKPPKVPSDTVIPFHFLDDQLYAKALILHLTYRFDGVLDVGKLKGALERLVELEGWRKLGGRVREGENGRLEYHVPEKYTEERPGFNWTHVEHQMSINEHELASQLPRTPADATGPVLFEDPAKFYGLICAPSTPRHIDDWLYTDTAPLSIHINSFTDATLLSMNCGHYLWDALGQASFLQAWIALLNGREADVPPVVGYDKDPFDKVGTQVQPEKYILRDSILTGWRWWLFVFNMIVELLWYRKQEGRAIFLPGSFVNNLRERAIASLPVDSEGNAPFLSEGDVLLAWWTRLTTKTQGVRGSTPVLIMNVSNLRGLIDEALPPGAAYLANATMVTNTHISAQTLLDQSLSQTALQIRNDLRTQRIPEQAHAWISLQKEMDKSLGRAPMVGQPGMVFHAYSNWHRGRFYDVDFSAAVVGGGKGGRPSYINVTGLENGFSTRNSGPILGRDGKGDWWMHWNLRAGGWGRVEEELRSLGEGPKKEI